MSRCAHASAATNEISNLRSCVSRRWKRTSWWMRRRGWIEEARSNSIATMARKRIKTLAGEWGVAVDDVLASANRLRLPHAHSESGLLSTEETERVKADLDEQAHRAAAMRRETVVETSAGKVLEKRLNATVMRRRHAEPEPGQAHATEPAEPFHFEVDKTSAEEPFIAPLFEEPLEAEPEIPELVEVEAAEPSPTLEPGPEGAEPVLAEREGGAAEGAAAPAEHPATPDAPQAPEIEAATPAPNGAGVPAFAQHGEAAATDASAAEAAAAAGGVEHRPAAPSAAQGGKDAPARVVETARPGARPAGHAGSGVRPMRPLEARGPVQAYEPGRSINLTGGAHASAPKLDDGPRGPKVLGKIDLRKPAVPRPAAPSTMRPGAGGRPMERARAAATPAAPPPDTFGPPPPDQAKPGARTIKKKRVVKKGTSDVVAEREMRGMRVPKKRRALPGKEQRKTEITTPRASKRVVRITEGVTVADLGRSMGVKAGDLIKKLMELGQMATLNQTLDVDTATLLASEFGYSVENVSFDAESAIEETTEEIATGEAVTRPPVVTVMGHVDHGKTSLLDAIRHTNVTSREFGGITQHIGAYTVESNGRKIAFVDTPGHEAFTAMRARGAKVTDIVVLVVAANEGVMPQTMEAVNHARAAKVPIIVAINKIDLPDANLDRVKQRLTEIALVPEDYGGDTITVPVSARTGEGIDRLLEMILLQAEVMDLKANPNRPARGTVIESQLDRGRGPVATVLVQEGTLHQGDSFVSGTSYGRVRAMQNHLGQRLAEAGPSTAVEIFGLSNVPEPGPVFTCVAEESKARQVAEYRRTKQREG